MIAGGLLLIVCVAHIARIVVAWPLTIGTADIPMWVSYVGAVVTGAVGFMTLREART